MKYIRGVEMSRTISKRKIKKYIQRCEEELAEVDKELKRKTRENERQGIMIYNIVEVYEKQAELQGKIEASYYILNCCLNGKWRVKNG